MTQEEKTKRYDEALALMQDCIPDENGLVHVRPYEIFPELRESEDEKIRNEIIESMRHQIDRFSDAPNVQKKYEYWIAWLEKQGETYTKKDVHDAYIKGMVFAKDKLEKQNKQILANSAKICKDEQKSADKVEPKFKVGDWVTDGDINLFQIIKIDNGWYYADDDDRVCFDVVHDYYHLWTIQDAKDGDVLYSLDSKQPFIFKHRKTNEQAEVYCGINIYGKFFVGNTKDCIITTDKYKPATKEQRDTLFAKMKEAGYEWDEEKKKLSGIATIGTYCKENCKGYQETGRCFADGECDTKKNAETGWSEEDEKRVNRIADFIWKNRKGDTDEIYQQEQDVNWLKSLKDRYTWKPSEEQIKAFEHFVRSIGESSYASPYENNTKLLYSLLNDLKKLTK